MEHILKQIQDDDKKDPLDFLLNISRGIDTREPHQLAERISNLDPDNYEDAEIKDLIIELQTHIKYKMVSVKDSLDATKELAKYVYPKRKSSEGVTSNINVELIPLSDEEVKKFDKWFDKEY